MVFIALGLWDKAGATGKQASGVVHDTLVV
jgi:hypothetical protein